MSDRRLVASTAITPLFWGTTYIVATEVLPDDRPLLAAALRALPAGVLLLVVTFALHGRLATPRHRWWARSAILGTLNIGAFFAVLFIAAYRLPGGIAAISGALAPFMVAGFAIPLLGERPTRRVIVGALFGALGVVMLVSRSRVALDPVGLAAAFTATASLSLGTVFGRRWGLPPGFPGRVSALVALTGWQLLAGSCVLLPLALAVEGRPPAMTGLNLLGVAYLTLFGTALAYTLWFRGVTRLPAARVTLLSLLSPVVAACLGWAVLEQSLSPAQIAGAAIVVASVLLGVSQPRTDTADSG